MDLLKEIKQAEQKIRDIDAQIAHLKSQSGETYSELHDKMKPLIEHYIKEFNLTKVFGYLNNIDERDDDVTFHFTEYFRGEYDYSGVTIPKKYLGEDGIERINQDIALKKKKEETLAADRERALFEKLKVKYER